MNGRFHRKIGSAISLQADRQGSSSIINKHVMGFTIWRENGKNSFNLLSTRSSLLAEWYRHCFHFSTNERSNSRLAIRAKAYRKKKSQKYLTGFICDNATTELQAGTGIGLSLVKELVTLLNGSISVQRSRGEVAISSLAYCSKNY